jgi:hypothetical protein
VELEQRQCAAEQAQGRNEQEHVSHSQRMIDQPDRQQGSEKRQDRTHYQTLIPPDLIQSQGGDSPARDVMVGIKQGRGRVLVHRRAFANQLEGEFDSRVRADFVMILG